MNTEQLAERYSLAFFNLAEEKQVLKKVFRDMEKLSEFFSGESPLLDVCRLPLIKNGEKAALLEKAFKDKTEPLTLDFLKLIALKGRAEYIKEIILQSQKMSLSLQGIKMVRLSYAFALSPEQKKELAEKLKKQTGANEIVFQENEDKSLIAGFKVEFDDKLADSTLKAKLKTLEQKFKEIH